MFGHSGPATNAAASDPTVPDEVTLDSRARIQAYFNVPRDKFEEDSYANGDTSELAARGLYGDPPAFSPARLFSTAPTAGRGHGPADATAPAARQVAPTAAPRPHLAASG